MTEETETDFDKLFEVHRKIIEAVYPERTRFYNQYEWEEVKELWRKLPDPVNQIITRINRNIEQYNLPLTKYKTIHPSN